ncbi:MAG: amidohydrolase family protein, partial [Chloroflexota bacterium]|nr:amidohydrolase family protein [Chloroflexota bacterium]
RHPAEYMKEFYYDLVSNHVPSIQLAAQVFGTDHLLLGSDYPFGLSDVEMAVQSVKDAGFTPQEQEDIYARNAVRLLGLEGRIAIKK